MNICIPILDLLDLNSTVSEHFGRASAHLLINSETMMTEILSKSGNCDDGDHGHCLPVDLLLKHHVEVVICKGIGKGAAARLLSNEIAVYRTDAATVSQALEQWRENLLSFVDSKDLCSGHSH